MFQGISSEQDVSTSNTTVVRYRTDCKKRVLGGKVLVANLRSADSLQVWITLRGIRPPKMIRFASQTLYDSPGLL